jgi:hypothetical protein
MEQRQTAENKTENFATPQHHHESDKSSKIFNRTKVKYQPGQYFILNNLALYDRKSKGTTSAMQGGSSVNRLIDDKYNLFITVTD